MSSCSLLSTGLLEQKPRPQQCVALTVPRLAARRPTGSVDTPRPVRWVVDLERGRLELYHDAKAYALALVPLPVGSGWTVNCPTCGVLCYKLWLVPTRYVFQCRLCAGVATWHKIRDRKLDDIGQIARRLHRLRRRYAPVVKQPTLAWYRGLAKIVALEDRLLELAGTFDVQIDH